MNTNLNFNLNESGEILIVDDTPANIVALSSILRDEGYRIRVAETGKMAIRSIKIKVPDLILLDIRMPGLNGFETLEEIRKISSATLVPVIFISADQEIESRLKGFSMGAVDYISKPFHAREVVSRVKNHMRTDRLQKELEQKYSRLIEVEKLRDDLVHMMVHDMRSPLQGILGSLYVLIESSNDSLTEGHMNILTIAKESTQRLCNMVTDLLNISRLENNKFPLDLEKVYIEKVVIKALTILGTAGVETVKVDISPELIVECDPILVQRIVENLVSNALKFNISSGEVKLKAYKLEDKLQLEVIDQGNGIIEESKEMLFEKFSQDKDGKRIGGAGLGLSFCKLAVEAHTGTIGAENTEEGGARFWFSIPLSH